MTRRPAHLFSYALFALPLAMAALPVYLFAPPLYVRAGLGLAGVGAVLLAMRLLAALADPLLGWWMARNRRGYPWHAAMALAPLLGGYAALFHPPPLAGLALMAWFACALLLVYLGYGLGTIAHQSWGAAIASAQPQRVRLMAAREGCALLGAVLAAGCTSVLDYGELALLFGAVLLACAWLLLRRAPRLPTMMPPRPRQGVPYGHAMQWSAAPRQDSRSRPAADARPGWAALAAPWRQPAFRALFGVYALSTLAGAIPATLFVFFAADRLRLPDSWAGPLLVLYLLSAAASMPLWSALARRWGEARAWQAGMLASAVVFCWACMLGSGQAAAFAVICLLSGMAGGADLALPPAMLAGLIGDAGVGEGDGRGGAIAAPYFAWWNWCSQLSLALAAGAMLPLLALLGYRAGASGPAAAGGITALAAVYALLPCVLKLLAWLLLRRVAPVLRKGTMA